MINLFKRAFALTLLAFSLSLLPVMTDQTASTAIAQTMPEYYRTLPWIFGAKQPKSVRLCDVLDFKLTRGVAILHQKGTQGLNYLTENPQTDECATIAPVSMDWFVMLNYVPIGYVSDDGKLDADALMESMKKANEVGNQERAKHGWAPLEMVGWINKPTYDASTGRLIWAVRLVSEGDETVNYETRLLGRRGVIEIMLVSAPEDMQRAIKEFNQLSKGLSFMPGERYKEVKPSDRRAKQTLSDLIVGD